MGVKLFTFPGHFLFQIRRIQILHDLGAGRSGRRIAIEGATTGNQSDQACEQTAL
jgi:hypothetical protein